MTHGAHLLLALLLLTSSSSSSSSSSSVSCPRTTVLSSGSLLHAYLRSSPPPLRLYSGIWSGFGSGVGSGGERVLLSCAWTEDADAILVHLDRCRERAPGFLDEPVSVSEMMKEEEEEQCVLLSSSSSSGEQQQQEARAGKRQVRSLAGPGSLQGSEVSRHQRVKRGFIVPGTLWCGSGNKAPSYSDLGVFAETDSCCREHDQCKNTILSFHSQFGVFNSNIFTMSHCDCDNRFHSCLMEANDSISDVVGYTFFNLLKMHCFTFSHRLQCAERNWFGMCKETKMALYAEVHSPMVYDTEIGVNGSVANVTAAIESSITDGAAASTVPTTSASIVNVTMVTAASAPEIRDDLENASASRSRDDPELQVEEDVTEKLQSCDVYRDLDECADKIFPQQKKHGLHNPENRMLYHCNCTSRLFQTLAKQRQVTKVQSLLLGRVSPSCFVTPNCTSSKICSGVLVKAGLQLQQLSSSRADVEEQRHLQSVTLKVTRPNKRRSKRKDRAVRLHRLCVKMVRPKVSSRTGK